MPRDARDLDPTDVVHAFAEELRRLREAAPARELPGRRNRHPRPWSVPEVAAAFGIGTSTIFNALNGERLPSRVTMDAMVIAWAPGGANDLPAWRHRRAEADKGRRLEAEAAKRREAEESLDRERAARASKNRRYRPSLSVNLTTEVQELLRYLSDSSEVQSRTAFLREVITSRKLDEAGYTRMWRSPDDGHILVQQGNRLVS